MKNIQNLSDKELYGLCQEFGKNIKIWKRKFAVCLPEVEKRKLYKKYGFHSLYEFAGKLGGLSQKTVNEILRTFQKVQDKPLLKAEIEKQGWAKVRAVTSIAENTEEENLVHMVRSMSKPVLEEAVRIIKKQEFSERNQNLFGEIENGNAENFPPGWKSSTKISFQIDSETEFKLRIFQQKLEKERKEAVTFNETLKALLNRAEVPKAPEATLRIAK
ncbi:MAG: hypothetical protein ABIH78_03665 [Candidatus Peregrinibacteria bacterium]